MIRWTLRSSAAVGLVLTGACAWLPLQPDLGARAPVLEGFGAVDWPITTRSAAAQRDFTQGVLQAYAFNEAEAVRMFKAALAQDPRCAMCAWGVAWQLGPNINNTRRDGAAEALRYLDLALRHAAGATPRERALIDAMALRYGHASQARETAPLLAEVCGSPAGDDERPDPLDLAYAARLRLLADAAPADADIVSMYAEAEMVATRTDWWNDATGAPGGRIGEVADRLERALQAGPAQARHTGLNHYLVHAVDAPSQARRAVAAADRLGQLAPASPHLVHMPSHIYVRVGRYQEAAQVNERAVAADLTLFDVQKAQGFDVSKDWRNHDEHFLWFAALMSGRGDTALAAARSLAERSAQADHLGAEYRRSLPVLALLRLERWDALLAEPLPIGPSGLAQALGQHARGVAAVRSGRLVEARDALAQTEDGAARLRKARGGKGEFDQALRGLADAVTQRLKAEIALAEGRSDEALALQAEAVASARRIDDNEPPWLAAGNRLVLGQMQLQAGRPADAEATFRADLAAQPGSGWAIDGLAQALRAQGKQQQADALRPDLAQAWSAADPALRRRL